MPERAQHKTDKGVKLDKQIAVVKIVATSVRELDSIVWQI